MFSLRTGKVAPSILRHLSLLAVTSLLFGTSFACNDGGNSESFERISVSDQTYTIDDFASIGFKSTRQYDVNGLPGGLDAHYGFWRTGDEPIDYELRFYSNHDSAIEDGQPLASEVSGSDAILDEDELTWPEGAKDRRAQAGGTGSTNLRFGTVYPRYGDYAIYGNVVMLCQGENSEASLDNCAALINALSVQSN